MPVRATGHGVAGIAVAAVGVAAVLLALTGDFGAQPPSPAAQPESSRLAATAPPPGATGPGPPEGAPPGAREVRVEIKAAATRFVERVGTWRGGAVPDPAAQLISAGYPPDLAPSAAPLFAVSAAESSTTVVYPQYGGLAPGTASVIVLARQQWRNAEATGVREIALDVRLRADGATWAVTAATDPARPPLPPARPGGATGTGRALLTTPRADLPDPVRADITDRRLDDPIMAVVLELARSYEIGAQVAASGHPGTVFPTPRLSNHAVGRAVDVREINGVRVVDIPRGDPELGAFMAAAGRAGATEVGGPIPVLGQGLFTDEVHQDHIHLGITPTKAPAAAVSTP